MQERLFVSYARQDRKHMDRALGKQEREGLLKLNQLPALIHDPAGVQQVIQLRGGA